MNRVLARAIGVLIVAVMAFEALAQGSRGISMVARFGYDNVVSAETWCPVRFDITSADRPVAGILELTHRQDGSQDARVSVPFSVLAGETTTAEVIVNLPSLLPGVKVQVMDLNTGRVLLSDMLNFENVNSRRITFDKPTIVNERVTVLAVGLGEMPDVRRLWQKVFMPPTTDYAVRMTRDDATEVPTIEQRAQLSVLEAGEMSPSWAAYDGVVAVVASASAISDMSERARRALLDWLAMGGQIVLVIDDSSNVWRNWLPAGVAADPVQIDERRTVSTPRALVSIQDYARASTQYNVEAATLSETIAARTMTIQPGALDVGWRSLLSHDEDIERVLIASGPVGFGHLTLIGFDPSDALALRSNSGVAVAWATLLSDAVRLPTADLSTNAWSYYTPGSGANRQESAAIGVAVNDLISVPGIGIGTIALLLAILGLAVIGLGPVDGFVLRALRLRHWSWLTACGWIMLASVMAGVIPVVTRSGESRVARTTQTDALLDARGDAVVSWATGVTVSYAGRSGAIGPNDARPGAWWRGVSPLESWAYQNDGSKLALSPLRLSQFSMAGAGGSTLGAQIRTPTQRTWTVRALLDVAPARAAVTARARRVDGAMVIRLDALDDVGEVELLEVRVRHDMKVWTIASPALNMPLTLGEADHAAAPATDSDRESTTTMRPWSATLDDIHNQLDSDACADLPGAQRRDAAIDGYGVSPHHAVITVSYRLREPDITLVGTPTFTSFSSARLVVPVVDGNFEDGP
jgi:hypothetical protein